MYIVHKKKFTLFKVVTQAMSSSLLPKYIGSVLI